MKKIALLLVAMMIASASFGLIYVMWMAEAGFSFDTFENNSQMLWSLVYSESRLSSAFTYNDEKDQLENGSTVLKYDADANSLGGTGLEVLQTRMINPSTGDVTVDGLADGDTVLVKATGTQTAVGKSSNTYTIDWGTVEEGN